MNIVLASASPRRSQLLSELGIKDFKIVPSQNEEKPKDGLSPEETVSQIALSKALDVRARCSQDDLIIAADTLVYLDGKPLGKPKNTDDAASMLRSLSGRQHVVITGFALILGDKKISKAEVTKVRFRTMTEEEIQWYISTGEPMDKAGAYGIQGKGSIFIEGIDGDFFNVMGLPMCALMNGFYEMGISMSDLGLIEG
jgi:septum formation protein